MSKAKLSTKAQVSLASVILVAALTPVVAHAAPGQDQGNANANSSSGNSASGNHGSGNSAGRGSNPGSNSASGTSGSGTSGPGILGLGTSGTPAVSPSTRSAANVNVNPSPNPAASSSSSTPSGNSTRGATVPGASRSAAATADEPCANNSCGPVLQGIYNLVKVTVQIGGEITYGFLDTTAGVLKLTGNYLNTIPIIGPVIGNVFLVVADATQKLAYAVAEATKVGPYSTTS